MALRFLRLLLPLLFAATSFAVAPAFAADTDSQITADDGQVTLAQEKRKKHKKGKKKRKKGGEEEPAAEAGGQEAPASTLHAAQEGVETPYKWQVSLLSDFSLVNEQTGDAKTGHADYNLNGKAGYIIAKSIVLGLGLDYAESSFKTEDATNTASEYLLRFFGDYLFGDVDKDDMLFFVEAGFGIGSSKSKAGDVSSKGSSTEFGVGLGLHYFVDSNVAFTGEFSYDTGSKKVDGVDEPTKFSTIHLMRLGFSLFL